MKQLILVAATGRCGTTKIEKLFSLVPGVFAERETTPQFSGVRQATLLDRSVGLEFTKNKIEAYNTNPEYDPYHTIAIAGHETGANFTQYFLENGVVPHVIFLRRPPREVALSLWKLEWIPGKVKHTFGYFNIPGEPDSLPFYLKQPNNYQICFWYCCEIERRLQRLKPLLQQHNAKVWEMTLQQMLDVNYFNKMLTLFDLPTLESVPQDKVHTYESYYPSEDGRKEVAPPHILDQLEQEVLDNIPAAEREIILNAWREVWPT